MNKKVTAKKSGTDWRRLNAMRDDDIDLSQSPGPTPKMFARAIVRRGLKPVPRKERLTLRVDSGVLHWLRSGGRGYRTRINTLLRAFMEAHK